jgi:hypothetical protein
MKQFIKPDPNCALCHGNGEVYDTVDYGSTTAQLPSFCDCVEMQALEDTDDIEIILDDTAMYRITIDVFVGEYGHEEYIYYLGDKKEALQYAQSYLQTVWGYGETIYEHIDDAYMSKDLERSAQFASCDEFNWVPAMSAKGAFHFQPTGWRII